MSDAKVGIVEVFASPQGEGFWTGRQALFVRLAGCPLACEFGPGVVCDTPYMYATAKLSVEQLFDDYVLPKTEHVRDRPHNPEDRLCTWRDPMIIFTGGEPVASPQFAHLVAKARGYGFYVAVETNGTIWNEALCGCDWVSVSPKDDVPQTSKAQYHNRNPTPKPQLHPKCIRDLADRQMPAWGGEYRYVITRNSPDPLYYEAVAHYVSPAVKADGLGMEWKHGFPGFAPGAVERCLQIIYEDPRWAISIQTHKVLGVQ